MTEAGYRAAALVFEYERRLSLPHVPLGAVRRHADEDVREQAVSHGVVDSPHFEVDPFQAT